MLGAVEVCIPGQAMVEGRGQSNSKKRAADVAAAHAYRQLVDLGLAPAMNEKPTETGPGTERPAGAPKNRTVEGVVRGQPPRKRSRGDDEIAAALPRLPHASGAPVTCYAYALSLPDVDMGRDYEHFAGLRFAGFHLISSTSLHIPQFKLCGEKFERVRALVAPERQLRLSAPELQVVRDVHEHLLHTILRVQQKLQFTPGSLYILPRFIPSRDTPDLIDHDDDLRLPFVKSLIDQRVPAYDRFHEILRQTGVELGQPKNGPPDQQAALPDSAESLRRAQTRVDAEFSGRIFFTTYNDSAYVLCGVNTDITPQHWFCSADREWTSFAQYYRQKKGIELAHVQQPMVVANQCNVGALANILPGTGTIIPERSPAGAPPGVPLALGKCLFVPLELCTISGLTFEMSTTHVHYLPGILNHCHDLQLFYARADRFQQAGHLPFINRRLLKEAFTHSTFAHAREVDTTHNERLEFLGDGVLEFLAVTRVFLRHPTLTEGELTEKKKRYTRNAVLALAAQELGLPECLLVTGHPMSNPQGAAKVSADLLEAVIAALFLDQGIDQANRFCEAVLFDRHQGGTDGEGGDDDHARAESRPFVRSPLYAKPTDPALGTDICPPVVREAAREAADVAGLESALGFAFGDKGYLQQAVTHKSFAGSGSKGDGGNIEEKGKEKEKSTDDPEVQGREGAPRHVAEGSYERLEFLGDCLLKFITSVHLYFTAPTDVREDTLTDRRSMLVRNTWLAQCTARRGLDAFLLHGLPSSPGPEDKVLGDLLESLIGAAYLDRGMADPETIQREHGCGCGVDVFGCLVHKIIIAGQAQPEEASCAPAVAHGPGAALGHDDAEDVRELLQVLCQRRGLPAPVYKEVAPATEGEGVRVEVHLQLGPGTGASETEAQRAAARASLLRWFAS